MFETNLARNVWFVVGLTANLLVVSCGSSFSQHAVEEKAPETTITVPSSIDAKLVNDAAHFLAGMPSGAGGAYHDLETSDAWADYSKGFDRTWAGDEKEQLIPVRAFAREHVHSGNTFLFYPFSGPDVLYATQFFPNSTLYVLAGLEPVGNLPPPSAYNKDTLPAQLNGLSTGVKSLFRQSFFVTSEMHQHFAGSAPVADGLLPVILMLLARTGHVIDGIQVGGISLEGIFEAQAVSLPKHQAVELVFHATAGGSRKTLYYVSTDLGSKYDPHKGFGKFVASHGQHDTFIKSATYLLHWPQFGTLRNHILETSTLILQDDTGVPYKDLAQPPWQLKLFGQYSAPGNPFKKRYQKDLAEAFVEPANTHELGFAIGYGYHRRSSSLMLATRSITTLKLP